MISPTRCLSSQATTLLLAKFRNPHGSERDWLVIDDGKIGIQAIHYGKVIATIIAASLLIVTASIETVAYNILLFPSFLLYPLFGTRPIKHLFSLIDSSSFTVYWNLINIGTNIYSAKKYQINFVTDESFIRLITNLFMRVEDSIYMADWSTEAGFQYQYVVVTNKKYTPRAEVILHGVSTQQKIEAGIRFFKKRILDTKVIDIETKKLIIDRDPSVLTFVLARSIYYYVFGSEQCSQIPKFFKKETRKAIKALRRCSAPNSNELRSRMDDFNEFKKEPIDSIKNIFNDLKNIARREGYDTLYYNACWSRACS